MVDDFADEGWRRLATHVLKKSLPLRRGEEVIIETGAQTVGMAETLAAVARRLGILPFVVHVSERSFLEPKSGRGASLTSGLGSVKQAALKSCHGYVMIPPGPEEIAQREALPESRRRAYYRERDDWYRALVRHKVPSVYLIGATATRANARRYRVNYRRWRDECWRASSVPSEVMRRAAKPIAERLARGRRVTIRHRNGTRLELGLARRKPLIEDGKVDAQDLASGLVGSTLPTGYVLTALDEKVAEGLFVANRPSRHPSGLIEGLRLTFRNGRLAGYEAREGRALFEASYGKSGRERDRPALLTIGLNPKLRDFPMAEDQERGVVTVYIGLNADFGGRSKGHFREYALLRGADLWIDEAPVLKAGRLT